MRKATAAWAFVTACALSIGGVSAQRARSYTWYGQLTSVDPNAKTITVTAQIRQGVTQYIGDFKPGDKLMLTWAPIQNESDSIIYAPKLEVMKGITEGYILPAEFVSANVGNGTLTFKTTVPDEVIQGVKELPPGKWIKVTTPMAQPREVASITAVAASEKPDLKPPPPPEPARAAAPVAPRPSPDASAASKAARTPGLPGTWTISSGGVDTVCVLKQEGTAFTGTCTSERGESDLTGEITGTAVKFKIKQKYSGGLTLEYSGTLDESGMTMLGMIGNVANFSAVKK